MPKSVVEHEIPNAGKLSKQKSVTCSEISETKSVIGSYWVHTLWMLNLLLAMAIVWWMAYRWRSNEHWTFLLFIWLLLSPTILYLISSLLFPDQGDGEPITDWKVYSYENHRDIFFLYALIFPIDIADTLFKGMAHFRAQGPLYVMTMALWFVLCLVAAFTKRRYYHAFFAVIFLIYNLVFVGTTLLTDQGVIGGIPGKTEPFTIRPDASIQNRGACARWFASAAPNGCSNCPTAWYRGGADRQDI
jgi:hypothetical protein